LFSSSGRRSHPDLQGEEGMFVAAHTSPGCTAQKIEIHKYFVPQGIRHFLHPFLADSRTGFEACESAVQ
jgi:hypothetical protein